MDLTAAREKATDFLKKYRYVILILLIGIGLMAIPDRNGEANITKDVSEQTPQIDETEQLTEILSQIKGAGKVRLLLTLAAGEKTIYQTDQSGQDRDLDTVIVTDADRAQQGLVQQKLSQEYRGAVVVCQGADDPSVRLAIVEAVSNATGLSTDRISVLKMK